MAKAKTTAQISIDEVTGEAPVQTTAYKKYRKMRMHPTIALAREYSVAYILASSWTVEGEDPEQVSFVEQVVLPMRTQFLRTALFGEADFGWKAYEKVFNKSDVKMPDDTMAKLVVLEKLKPLKNDTTLARYDKQSGDFIGLSTIDLFTSEKIFIDEEHSLFVNFDDEGLGMYAQGRMERIAETYDQWNEANDGLARYDKKIAGVYLVVWYPVGSTLFNGAVTDNAEIAKSIIKALTSNGTVSIGRELADIIEAKEAENNGWRIEFLDTNAKQAAFVDRLKYLDAQMARGYAVPERAILEGEFGTKAEAGVHASAALLNMDLRHNNLTQFVNDNVVNQLTEQNWMEKDTTRIVAQPLRDERLILFKELLIKMMEDPAAGPDVMDAINVEKVCEVLGIPLADVEGPDDSTESSIAPDAEDVQSVGAEPVAATSRLAPMNGRASKVTMTIG